MLHGQVEVLELLLESIGEADRERHEEQCDGRCNATQGIYPCECGPDTLGYIMPSEAMQAARSAAAGIRKRNEEDDRLGWLDRSDGFEGFQVLKHFPSVALAVSKTGKFEAGKAYPAPAGWHWASRAEAENILCRPCHLAKHNPKLYYSGQGCWDDCTWGGVERRSFLYKNSSVVGGSIAARHHEGQLDTCSVAAVELLADKLFAGIVCVADGTKSNDPNLVCIKVRGMDGTEVFFKIKRKSALKKLMDVYALRMDADGWMDGCLRITPDAVRFIFDGNRIVDTATPDDLEMEDDDVIDAMLWRGERGTLESYREARGLTDAFGFSDEAASTIRDAEQAAHQAQAYIAIDEGKLAQLVGRVMSAGQQRHAGGSRRRRSGRVQLDEDFKYALRRLSEYADEVAAEVALAKTNGGGRYAGACPCGGTGNCCRRDGEGPASPSGRRVRSYSRSPDRGESGGWGRSYSRSLSRSRSPSVSIDRSRCGFGHLAPSLHARTALATCCA